MIEIYAIRLKENLNHSMYNKGMAIISDAKCERIKKYHNLKAAQRVLFAEVLLRNIICDKLKIKNTDIDLYYNEYGKPFLEKYNLNFNISHSGNWVVCAVNEDHIGIDIEQIQPIDYIDIADNFFSSDESKDLNNKVESDRLAYFYDLWTLKESYVKAEGKGLSIPLHSFTMAIDNECIKLTNIYPSERYFFKQYLIDNNYKLSVCAKNNKFPSNVIIQEIDELLDSFV
jgi:4'-phosphopantetheinyl transferase